MMRILVHEEMMMLLMIGPRGRRVVDNADHHAAVSHKEDVFWN